MRLLLALVLALLAGACVTPGDVREVADLVAQFGEDLEDESKTVAELVESAEQTADAIEDVGERALERAERGLTAAQGAGISGVLSTAAAAALHVIRNRREERRRYVRREEDRARVGDVER